MIDLHHTEQRLGNARKLFKDQCINCYNVMEKLELDLRANDYSKHRVLKYWRILKTNHEILGACFEKATKEDIKRMVVLINENPKWAEETKSDKKLLTKILYRWLINEKLKGSYPDLVDWIIAKPKKNKEKPPEAILTKDDVLKLVKGARTQFERTFISAIFWSGCRISEIMNLRIRDIEPSVMGHFLNVSGKTGARKIRILSKECCEELNKWLSEHPTKHDENSYIFVKKIKKTGEIRVLSREYIDKMIKSVAKKVGLTGKPTNPHAFRFALATYFASKDISERVMNSHFGWSAKSDQASHYSRISRKQVDDVLLKRISGIDLGDTEIKERDNDCPKCNAPNKHFEGFCVLCKFPLNLKNMAEYDNIVYDKVEALQKKVNALSKTLMHLINQDEDTKIKIKGFIKQEGIDKILLGQTQMT